MFEDENGLRVHPDVYTSVNERYNIMFEFSPNFVNLLVDPQPKFDDGS